jgi:hypothetical protein
LLGVVLGRSEFKVEGHAIVWEVSGRHWCEESTNNAERVGYQTSVGHKHSVVRVDA